MIKTSELIAYRCKKTTKTYKCFGCDKELPKGSTVNVVFIVENGRAKERYDICDDCWNKILNHTTERRELTSAI